jgi:hypothetical protein
MTNDNSDFRGKKPPCISNSEWDLYWSVGIYAYTGNPVGSDTAAKYEAIKKKIESCTPNWKRASGYKSASEQQRDTAIEVAKT